MPRRYSDRADRLTGSLTASFKELYLTDSVINQSVQRLISSDRLSTTFSALSDPTRRAILARLALGETSVTELAEPFAMSLPAISKHLKVLERAGLITRGRAAQWRPCRIEAGPLKDAAGWLEHYRRFWDESFDRLDEYLQQLQATENGSGHEH
jgi:DNA-binding transcriptional ArsR family regulator